MRNFTIGRTASPSCRSCSESTEVPICEDRSSYPQVRYCVLQTLRPKYSKGASQVGCDMGSQLNASDAYKSDSVIAFVPAAKSAVSKDADQLDAAGQTILSLLHKAAGMAEENSKHALDLAQKLSHQLRAAETQVAGLEAQVRYYQDKTERSEQWLHKIYSEIEERFFRPEDKRGGVNSLQRPTGRRA